MEEWEKNARDEVFKTLGPVGGDARLRAEIIYAKSIKSAEQMALSYDHVLPKLDLNHNGKVDLDEIAKAKHSAKSDAETKQVACFLDKAMFDVIGMRLPGKDSYKSFVTAGDMKNMVSLLKSDDGHAIDAMEKAIASIKLTLKEQEAHPNAGLPKKAFAFAEQASTRLIASDTVKSQVALARQDLNSKLDHVRGFLRNSDLRR